jgi:intermembrane space import and assembly protein 40
MFKSALRGATRATITPRSPALRSIGAKRFASSSGPGGKRTWKSGAARWLTVGAGVWWYNTSDIFKEDSEGWRFRSPARFLLCFE